MTKEVTPDNIIGKIERHSPGFGGYLMGNMLSVKAYDPQTGKVTEIVVGKTLAFKSQVPGKWFTEVFTGKNYVLGSSAKSHSRQYPGDTYPVRMAKIVKYLRAKHRTVTKW